MSFRLLKSLFVKSTRIQQEIEREQIRPRPDQWRLLKLKKIRLAIKDKMERIIQYGTVNKSAHLRPVRITMPSRTTAHNK